MSIPNQQTNQLNANDGNQPPASPTGNQTGVTSNQQEGNQSNNQNSNTNNQEVKLPELTPEQQKLLDSQFKAARKAGEEEAKKKLDKEQQDAKEAQETEEAKQKGETQKLYDTEVKKHNETKETLTAMQRENNQLKAALEAGVPNPLVNCKRIVGDDYDAMVADAKVLASSFSNQAHRDAGQPPVTPNANDGGQFQQQGNSLVQPTQQQLDANRGGYNLM